MEVATLVSILGDYEPKVGGKTRYWLVSYLLTIIIVIIIIMVLHCNIDPTTTQYNTWQEEACQIYITR